MPQSNIDKRNSNKNYKESEKSVNMIFCVIVKVASFVEYMAKKLIIPNNKTRKINLKSKDKILSLILKFPC